MKSRSQTWPKAALAATATAAVLAASAGPVLADDPAPDETPETSTDVTVDSVETFDTETPDVETFGTETSAAESIRIGGTDRYETAAAVALSFEQQPDVVYIATGDNFADALAARAWSGHAPEDVPTPTGMIPQSHDTGVPAPVLLTQEGFLPQVTVAALNEIAPDEIRIVGGTAVVSQQVQDDLEDYADTVTRLGGTNRYETSAAIAAQFPTGGSIAFLVSGEQFADALAAGAVAGRSHAPVLLTRGAALSSPTAEALERLDVDTVVVVGGTDAVSETAATQVEELGPDVVRIGGASRYDTAALLAAAYERDGQVVFATGLDFPDALAGSALASQAGAPILLTNGPSDLSNATVAVAEELSPQAVAIVGGTSVIAPAVELGLNERLPFWVDEVVVQVLGLNDYHGHLEATDGATLSEEHDPDQNLVGGSEYLATWLDVHRGRSYEDQTVTVAAGDLIGGSPFLSGVFREEPSVESLNALGLDISSVGNHEFDQGTDELLRMQNGGCLEVDGEADCFFDDEPFAGADFQWLSANVVDKESGETLLPGTEIRTFTTNDGQSVDVGFIGMTLEDTPTLVSPGGVETVDFLPEAETANAAAAALKEQGADAVVVLLHEGGYNAGTFNDCQGVSEPIAGIVGDLDDTIDTVVTGHTHEPYVCSLPNSEGEEILVTSANEYGRVVTDIRLSVSVDEGAVNRERTVAENYLVTREGVDRDAELTALIAKWSELGDEVAAEVVGTITADITGDASTCRCEETALGNLVADSILWGTEAPANGGAEIAFMNIGGIRANLLFDAISHGEQPGEVTYAEARAVAPFGNIVTTFDFTGADIKEVLEQQYVPDRGRPFLHLATSEGLTYDWDKGAAVGEQISNLELNGEPIDPDATYRVATLNFLAEGGDQFTAFTNGENFTGGQNDLANLVGYLGDNPNIDPPATDRVNVTPAP